MWKCERNEAEGLKISFSRIQTNENFIKQTRGIPESNKMRIESDIFIKVQVSGNRIIIKRNRYAAVFMSYLTPKYFD